MLDRNPWLRDDYCRTQHTDYAAGCDHARLRVPFWTGAHFESTADAEVI